MTELMRQITSRKLERPKQLSTLPVGEKLRLLAEMVKGAKTIRGPRPPKPTVPSRREPLPAAATGLLMLLALLPTLSQAQGTPDTSNSRLWDMRKKVQQRNAQRTGTYLEQMSQALQSGDTDGAESALKSAIAQGKLTQPQIDDARGQIQSEVSKQQQALVAAGRAKADAEAREAEAQRATAPTSPSGTPNGPAASSPNSISINFDKAPFLSVRVFNVDSNGKETRWPNAASPGNCSRADYHSANDSNYQNMTVNVFAEKGQLAGAYGFEVKMQDVVDNKLFSPNTVKRYPTVNGTFTIPAGKDSMKMNWDKYDKKFKAFVP